MTHTPNTKNAPGDGAATPHATEGVRPTTYAQETVMTNDTRTRPWLDDATAKHLTDTDLAKLDADYARWSADEGGIWKNGYELVDYMRDQAADQARLRRIMGPAEVPLPEFATVHKHTDWELTPDGTDCVRSLDAVYADHKGMSASLEVDQYAVSTRMELRVRIDEGQAESPAELSRWALDLLALAGTWTEIQEGQA